MQMAMAILAIKVLVLGTLMDFLQEKILAVAMASLTEVEPYIFLMTALTMITKCPWDVEMAQGLAMEAPLDAET